MAKTNSGGFGAFLSPSIPPLVTFDRLLGQGFEIPQSCGRKLVEALNGPQRGALLRAVDAALRCPPEQDHEAIADAVARHAADCLMRLTDVQPHEAGTIIRALRFHPSAMIVALNGLPLPRAAWETDINVNEEFLPRLPVFDGETKTILRQEGVDTATKSTPRDARHPLLELPKGLRWPKDFDQADEFGRHPKAPGGIVAYLEREWKDIIAAEKIDMPTLREHFPKAAAAISAYTTPHRKTGEARKLPDELTIPVYPEVNTRKLERVRAGEEIVNFKEAVRLFYVEQKRVRRAAASPKLA